MKVYPNPDECYFTLHRTPPFEDCEEVGIVAVEIPDEEVAEFEHLSAQLDAWNKRIAALIRTTLGGRV